MLYSLQRTESFVLRVIKHSTTLFHNFNYTISNSIACVEFSVFSYYFFLGGCQKKGEISSSQHMHGIPIVDLIQLKRIVSF